MKDNLKSKLDRLWSKIVKERAGNRCEKCGKTTFLNAHHVVGKRNLSLRWNISNGCCLCPACHTFSSVFSAHQTPTLFAEWIISQRGQAWHDDLSKIANTIKKWTHSEKELLFKEFKEMTE